MSNWSYEDVFSSQNVSPQKQKIELKPIAEILSLADIPMPWLVEDLLIQGGSSLLVAKPKVGKTTFSRCLALAVARGTLFLGKSTRKSKVLLISLEDKLSEVGRHFRILGANEGDEILLLSEPPKGAKALREIIESHSFGLVIIDTLVLGVRNLVDINDYLQVSQALAPYIQVARDTNAHLIFNHHLAKKERGGGDQILGSTALFGAVDVVMLIDRQKQRRVFSTIARYGTDWASSELAISEESHELSICTDNYLNEDEQMCRQIELFLQQKRQPQSEKQIENSVSGRTDRKRRCLRHLVAIGVLKKNGKGTRGSEFLYSCTSL